MAHICAEDGRPLPAYAQAIESRILAQGHQVLPEILAEFDEVRKATPERVTHDMWETILASCVSCGQAAEAVSYFDQAVAAGYFQGPEYVPVNDDEAFLNNWPTAEAFRRFGEASINTHAFELSRQLSAPPSRVPPHPSNSSKASASTFVHTLLRSFFYNLENRLGARLADDRIDSELKTLLTNPLFSFLQKSDADVSFGQLSEAEKSRFVEQAATNNLLTSLLVERAASLPGLHSAVQAEAPGLAKAISTQLQHAFDPKRTGSRFDALELDAQKFTTEQLAAQFHQDLSASLSDSDPSKAYILENNAEWTADLLELIRDPRTLTALKNEERLSTQHLDKDEECRKAQLEHEQQLKEAEKRYSYFQALSTEEKGRVIEQQANEVEETRRQFLQEALPIMELLKSHVPLDREVDDEPRDLWEKRWAFLSSEADRYAAANFRFNGTTELDRINDFVMSFHLPEKRLSHRLYFAKQIVQLFGYKPLDWFLASSFGITPPGYYHSSSPEFDEFTRSLEASATPEAAIAFLQARIPIHSSKN